MRKRCSGLCTKLVNSDHGFLLILSLILIMLQYTNAYELLLGKDNIRVVEMSMNDAWFRDIGPTVSSFVSI